MSSITDLLFHPLSNAIMTVLTGITALYWITTFIAGDLFSDSGIDSDFPVHGADVDTDVEGDVATDQPFFQKALEFVNIGKVPLWWCIPSSN